MNPGGNQVSDDGHWQLVNDEWVPTQMQMSALAGGAAPHQVASQFQAATQPQGQIVGAPQAFAQVPQTVVVSSGGGGAGKVIMIIGIVIAVFVALSVVLSAVMYVWASSLAGDSAGGSLDAYQFDDRDAPGSMSDGAGDALVEITMTQGTDLNWAMLKVSIKVDGGTPQSCGEAGGDDACSWTPFEGSGNDQAWEASEGITISEGTNDLCDGEDGGCSIEITITKKGTGSNPDMVLATVNAYADAAN